ncbi:MAG: acetyl-CoA C-acyltransferase, partial [Candidatus Hydrogenedens sp.]|nr:acetyl-CoA C-acyltransferase [Candidatus Hydrogenedens sp.]
MEKAYVISAVRTAVGKSKAGSAIAHVRPDDLGAAAIAEAFKRAGIPAERIGDCVMGCAFPEAEAGMNTGRIALLAAGLPDTIPGETVNRFCSSGLEAMNTAAMRLELGIYDAAIAGGLESMSVIPIGGNKTCPHPGLTKTNPRAYTGMGQCSDNVAKD